MPVQTDSGRNVKVREVLLFQLIKLSSVRQTLYDLTEGACCSSKGSAQTLGEEVQTLMTATLLKYEFSVSIASLSAVRDALVVPMRT